MAKMVKFTSTHNGKSVFVNVECICFIEGHDKHEDQTVIVFADDMRMNVEGAPEHTYQAIKIA